MTSAERTAWHRTANPIRRAIAGRFVLLIDVVIRSPEVLAEQRDEPFFGRRTISPALMPGLTTLSPISTLST